VKKLLFASILLFTACESEEAINPSEVPSAVMSTFNEKYPAATSVTWELEDNIYEAEFKLDGKKKEVEFSADGKFLREE
jgi:hypothetical protein